MKVIITGGGGFLGFQLCQKLRQRGTLIGPSGELEPIDEIVLFDAFFSETVKNILTNQQGTFDESIGSVREGETKQQGTFVEPTLSDQKDVLRQPSGLSSDRGSGPLLSLLVRDISDRDAVFEAIDGEQVSVFHLASMVSGECEQEFDKALSVNLDGGRHVFEATRARGPKSKVLFASSIACFGGEDMPERMTDSTKQWPQTTYGMTKAIGELMVNDFSRKGFFDGRSARLPTVIVRPGKPNAAASSWASGMFREPLNGEPCYLPVHRNQCHPMTGYRTVIESLMALHDLPAEKLGNDRAVGLPAHRVTPAEAECVVNAVAEEKGILPGLLVDDFNSEIQAIVDNWPTAVDGARGVKLGMPEPPPLREILLNYLEDFGNAG